MSRSTEPANPALPRANSMLKGAVTVDTAGDHVHGPGFALTEPAEPISG